MSPTEIIDLYCQAWSAPNANDRAALLARVWGDGATYTDPNAATRGAEALLALLQRIQLSRPGAQVVRCTEVDGHHGFARFGFKVIGANGAILREGTDIVTFSADGSRIDSIVGFFGELKREA